MDPQLKNLLYDQPELYEEIYPRTERAIPEMCVRLFRLHARLPGKSASLLDLGCGTGRHVDFFTTVGFDCVGIDCQQAVVDFARRQRPGLNFHVGDMLTLRLGRHFDAIVCLGWSLAHIQSNSDLVKALRTFAAHSRPGTLLVLHVPNAITVLQGSGLQREFRISTPDFKAEAEATYQLDRRHQLLLRHRLWHIDGQSPRRDFSRFRLLFPMELQGYLSGQHFNVVGMFDNPEAKHTDLSGPDLFVLARYEPGSTVSTEGQPFQRGSDKRDSP